MLHTKSINEISYDDVVRFCQAGNSESFILEYKRDFPSNDAIAKAIAALANTYGGLLIIGVNAPAGKPVPPFEGITFDSSLKYEDKIESVVLSHIREPVFPEIRVCDPVNGKTFVVIRVSESHLTPHRVSDNRRIYVRTGQQSTPVEEATWDKVEWLISRRKKSEDFRELLLAEAENYFEDACQLRGIRLDDRDHYFAILTLRTIPIFPQHPLLPFKELAGIENHIRVSGFHSLPLVPAAMSFIQNGVHHLEVMGHKEGESAHGKGFEYTYLNAFGTYLYKRDEGEFDKKQRVMPDGSKQEIITKQLSFVSVFIRLYMFLEAAVKLYERMGYWGTLLLQIELKNALGVIVPHPFQGRIVIASEDRAVTVPSAELRWEKRLAVHELRAQRREIVLELTDAIAWSLNIRYLNKERILELIKTNFRA
jgi:schlafen family protein